MTDVLKSLAAGFEVMDQGFAIFDGEFRLVICNSRFAEIRGYPASLCRPGVSLEDLLRHNAERGDYGDEGIEQLLASRLDMLRKLEAHSVERMLPNGNSILIRYDPIPGGGLLASYVDITALRAAEQQSRELAKLPEQNPGPVLRFSSDGMLLYANAPSAVLLRDVGLAVGGLVPETWRAAFEEVSRSGDSLDVEHEHGERTYTLTWFPVPETGNVNIYGRDITALRQAERQVRELAKLPEQNPGPVLRFARDGSLIYGNSASEPLRSALGLSPGQPAPETWQRALGQAVASGRSAEMDYEVGGRTYVLTLHPVAETGNVNIYGRDITARKRAERELALAKARAEAALADLEAAQENLVHAEKMASLGQLTAGVAHEIKNPLNFVNNFAKVSWDLLQELSETLSPAVEALDADDREDVADLMDTLSGNLAKIKEHGARADGIVRSMLAHAHHGPSASLPTAVNALVEESLNLAYHGARAEDDQFNVTFERALDPAAGEAELYPQEIMRVLINLVGNGFHATQAQRRQESEAVYVPTLGITTRDLGEQVEIRIRDNGTGMPPDVASRVFEPFFTTKRAGEGTGLGLSLSYETVVQHHHGELEVDSEEGKYTEFTIRLPRSAPTQRSD